MNNCIFTLNRPWPPKAIQGMSGGIYTTHTLPPNCFFPHLLYSVRDFSPSFIKEIFKTVLIRLWIRACWVLLLGLEGKHSLLLNEWLNWIVVIFGRHVARQVTNFSATAILRGKSLPARLLITWCAHFTVQVSLLNC